ERGLDRMELYAASLGNRGDACRQAARKTGENELDRSRSIVLGCKDRRVVCLDRKRLVAGLFRSESEVVADRGAAVRALQPLAACAPLELRCCRCFLQSSARVKQCSHIDAVIHLCIGRLARGHCLSLLCLSGLSGLTGRAVGTAGSFRRATK